MFRRGLLMLIVAIAAVLLVAQDRDPCVDLNAQSEGDACVQRGTVSVDVQSPLWLAEYPNALAAVAELQTDLRRAFFVEIAEYGLFVDERPLVFEMTYTEIAHNDDIVTVWFTSYTDYGGLYPISGVHTVTVHRADDRVLTIADLFIDDVDLKALLLPYIEAEIGDLSLVFFDEARWDDVDAYNTFTLSDDTLTLLYPFTRTGPVNAGTLPVAIPLDDLADVWALDGTG